MSAKIFEAPPLVAGTDTLKSNDRVKLSLKRLNLSKRKKLILGISAVAALAFAGYYFWGGGTAAPTYMTAKIERGKLRNTVTATGTLQAVTTVQVGSQASGTISPSNKSLSCSGNVTSLRQAILTISQFVT